MDDEAATALFFFSLSLIQLGRWASLQRKRKYSRALFSRWFEAERKQQVGVCVCVRIGIVLKFRQHIHSRQAFVLTTPQGCTYVCKYIRTVLRFFEVLWHIIVTLNLYSIKCIWSPVSLELFNRLYSAKVFCKTGTNKTLLRYSENSTLNAPKEYIADVAVWLVFTN